MGSGTVSIIAGASAFVGVAVGLIVGEWRSKRLRRRNRELRSALNEGREPEKPETMKRVIWVCLVMGFAWVWCSYILAYLDHPQIAESLSQVAVTEIIGVVLAYAIKSSIENLSKHNHWPDKGDTAPKDENDDGEQAAG